MTSEVISICICTYRRSSLSATLASVAAQILPAGVSIVVIVADNDKDPVRQAGIEAEGRLLGLEVIYVHAPSRNISIARNACLDAVSTEWVAFIDDDEEAAPDWIAMLLAAREGAEIVFGVSQAMYRVSAYPSWIVDGDFHSNRLQGNDAAWNGYTANVLLNHTFLLQNGLRFELALGQVGGEDTMLFYQCHLAGACFAYAPQAVVFEDTPATRATLSWLLKRRYRSGQVHFMILQLQGRARMLSLASGLAKAFYSFANAVVRFPHPVKRAACLLRGAMHIGVVAAAIGASPYLEYGEKNSGL